MSINGNCKPNTFDNIIEGIDDFVLWTKKMKRGFIRKITAYAEKVKIEIENEYKKHKPPEPEIDEDQKDEVWEACKEDWKQVVKNWDEQEKQIKKDIESLEAELKRASTPKKASEIEALIEQKEQQLRDGEHNRNQQMIDIYCDKYLNRKILEYAEYMMAQQVLAAQKMVDLANQFIEPISALLDVTGITGLISAIQSLANLILNSLNEYLVTTATHVPVIINKLTQLPTQIGESESDYTFNVITIDISKLLIDPSDIIGGIKKPKITVEPKRRKDFRVDCPYIDGGDES